MEASGLLLAALPFCTSNSLSFSPPVLMKFHWLVVGPQRGVQWGGTAVSHHLIFTTAFRTAFLLNCYHVGQFLSVVMLLLDFKLSSCVSLHFQLFMLSLLCP